MSLRELPDPGPALPPVFFAAIFLSAGIAAGRFWDVPECSRWWQGAAALVLILAAFARKESKISFAVLGTAAVFSLGLFLSQPGPSRRTGVLPPGPARLLGRIDSFPQKLTPAFGVEKTRFLFRCSEAAEGAGPWRTFSGRVRVTVQGGSDIFLYGDEFLLEGDVLKAGPARNPGGFDADAYLWRQNLSAAVTVRNESDRLRPLARAGRSLHDIPALAMRGIQRLRIFLVRRIESKIPAPESDIAKALLLGEQQTIPAEIRDAFSKSGTAHLLALSGGNAAWVALLSLSLLRLARVPRRAACIAAIAVLAGYCLLTGAEVSMVRGTVMVGFYLAGIVLKRDPDVLASLSWSALMILGFAPLQLFDAGFQLSFLTVLFIFLFARREQKREEPVFVPGKNNFPSVWERNRRARQIRDGFRVSLSAWIGVIPLTADYFFLFSPVTVFSNLLAVPYVTAVLFSGFAFLIFDCLHPGLGSAFAASTCFLIRGLNGLCRIFSSLPGSSFRVPPPGALFYGVYYGLVCLYLLRERWELSVPRFCLIAMVFADLFVWKGMFEKHPRTLRAAFLDVGHGDCSLFRLPGGGCLLVDAGAGGDWDQGRFTVAPFLWSRGITNLDGVLITHPHFDHYGGLEYLLKEFKVETLFDNGGRLPAPLAKAVSGRKIRRVALRTGDAMDVQGVRLTVLSSIFGPGGKNKAPNDQSLVFRVAFGSAGILMAGDAEAQALSGLMAYGPRLRSDLLKVPHHGGYPGAVTPVFLEKVSARAAVVSEAEKNRFHLPDPRILEALARAGVRAYQTGVDGAVEWETDGQSARVETFLDR